MKLVPYNKNDIDRKHLYRQGRNMRMLEEFMESGLDCVKIEDYPHKNATICQQNLTVSITRMGLRKSVKVVKRKDEVFLLRTNPDE